MNIHATLLLCTMATYCMCCDKDSVPAQKGCCEIPSISQSVGDGKIYVPNVFTPDGDGINDNLYITTTAIQRVFNLEIADSKDNIVFEVISSDPNDPDSRWDGMVNGEVKEGVYSLALSVEANNGTTEHFDTYVCVYLCNAGAPKTKLAREACHFGSQVNTNNEYDPSYAPGELPDCFE